MGLIGQNVSIGRRSCYAYFQRPVEVPTGDGGFTVAWEALDPPALFVAIEPATAQDQQRLASLYSTVASNATHTIRGPFHPGVTTKSRIVWGDRGGVPRVFQVVGVSNRDERNSESILAVVEHLPNG